MSNLRNIGVPVSVTNDTTQPYISPGGQASPDEGANKPEVSPQNNQQGYFKKVINWAKEHPGGTALILATATGLTILGVKQVKKKKKKSPAKSKSLSGTKKTASKSKKVKEVKLG